MKELMIHVEKIVRPIRGDGSKLKMRRELLGHLQASFEALRAEGMEEAAALTEVKRRLGEPDALRRQLQASLPRWERIVGTPLPGSVRWVALLLGIALPILAMLYVPARYPWIFVAGLVMLAADVVFWYGFSIGFFRPRVAWGRMICSGIAASIAQFAWMSLVIFGLSGRPLSIDILDMALALILLPAFFLLGGAATMLANRQMREWLELNIAD